MESCILRPKLTNYRVRTRANLENIFWNKLSVENLTSDDNVRGSPWVGFFLYTSFYRR